MKAGIFQLGIILAIGVPTALSGNAKYFHLLGLVPISTGREYQTVVTKEGNIATDGFSEDFIAAVAKTLRAAEVSDLSHDGAT